MMYRLACVLLFNIIYLSKAAERGSSCFTPNRENGTCIPVDNCLPIKRAITFLSKEALDFAKRSQCGYDDTPLVCCGSSGRYTSTTTTTPTTRRTATTRTTAKTTRTTARTTTSPFTNTNTPSTTSLPTISTTETNFQSVDEHLPAETRYCGIHNPDLKTEEGRKTQIREFPWLVSLKYLTNEGNNGGLRCTGTLINERYVLTAAECLDMSGFDLISVVLGRWDYSSDSDCYKETKNKIVCALPVEIPVDEEIIHPEYYKRDYDKNIGLIRLGESIEYDDFIQPICLPPKTLAAPSPGMIMETAGWNIHVTGSQWNAKMKGQVCVVSNKDCEVIDANFNNTYPHSGCVNSVANSMCIDNSGSPLMNLYRRRNDMAQLRWYQEGIVYKGLGCPKKRGYPASYTRISKHREWIDSNMWI